MTAYSGQDSNLVPHKYKPDILLLNQSTEFLTSVLVERTEMCTLYIKFFNVFFINKFKHYQLLLKKFSSTLFTQNLQATMTTWYLLISVMKGRVDGLKLAGLHASSGTWTN
jgi:hypothetical protein